MECSFCDHRICGHKSDIFHLFLNALENASQNVWFYTSIKQHMQGFSIKVGVIAVLMKSPMCDFLCICNRFAGVWNFQGHK